MELISHNDGSWSLRKVSELEYLMLSRIQESADPAGCNEACSRLYPSPVTATADLDQQDTWSIEADWREYTEPDLRKGFGKAIQTVAADIESAAIERVSGVDFYEINVPKIHAEYWCSALNQARLVSHYRHDLPAEPGEISKAPGSEEWMAMLQSEIYGVIMEFLVTRVLWIK